jgi:5-methylcytosine-specific restriction endonuclease McrA
MTPKGTSRRTVPLPRDWKTIRARVLRRHAHICHVCGEAGADEVDHVVPAVRGGTDDEENLRPIHGWRTGKNCHLHKTAQEAHGEARRRPAEKHPGMIA